MPLSEFRCFKIIKIKTWELVELENLYLSLCKNIYIFHEWRTLAEIFPQVVYHNKWDSNVKREENLGLYDLLSNLADSLSSLAQ